MTETLPVFHEQRKEKHKVKFCSKSEMGYLITTNKKIEIFFLFNSISIQTPIF